MVAWNLVRRCAAGRATPGRPVLVQLVREIDDAQAGAALEEGAQAQDIAVVENSLPPMSRHECGQDDGNALVLLLVEPFEVREHWRHERAIRGLDHEQRYVRDGALPFFGKAFGFVPVLRYVDGGDHAGYLARHSDRPARNLVDAVHRHDYVVARCTVLDRCGRGNTCGQRCWVHGDLRLEPVVMTPDQGEHSHQEEHHEHGEPGAVSELRPENNDRYDGGCRRAQSADHKAGLPAALLHPQLMPNHAGLGKRERDEDAKRIEGKQPGNIPTESREQNGCRSRQQHDYMRIRYTIDP